MSFEVGDPAGVLGGLVDGAAVLGDVERREPVAVAGVELDEGFAQAVGNDGPAEVGLLVTLYLADAEGEFGGIRKPEKFSGALVSGAPTRVGL